MHAGVKICVLYADITDVTVEILIQGGITKAYGVGGIQMVQSVMLIASLDDRRDGQRRQEQRRSKKKDDYFSFLLQGECSKVNQKV